MQFLLVFLFLITSSGEGETPPPARRLEALLRELKQTDPKVWEQRIQELRAQIAAHQKKADSLRKQAQKLRKQAEAEVRKGKAIEAEIQKLVAMRDLVGPETPKKKPNPKPKPKKNPTKKPKARPVTFDDDILPLFEESCLACHDAESRSGDLDVSSYAALLEGGGSGAVIQPGDPDGSRLFRLVSHAEKPYMPPRQPKMGDAKLARMRQWIAKGAPENAASAKKAADAVKAKSKETSNAPRPPRFDGPPPMPERVDPASIRMGPRQPVAAAMATSPRAPLVAVPGHGQIVLHHGDTLAPLGGLAFPPGGVEVLDFTVDGTKLLAAGGVAGKSGGAVLYDVVTGAALRSFGWERDRVLAATISPGQSLVALGGVSKKIRVYGTETGEKLYEIDAHKDWVLSLHVSPDGNWLASSDRAGQVRVFEADTGRDVHRLAGHEGPVHRLRFRRDARELATAGEDGTVRIWELEDGKQVRRLEAHRGAVLGLAWGADHRLATGGSDGIVKIWKPDGSLEATMPPREDWVYSVALDAKGARLFSGDWQGSVAVHDARGGALLGELGAPASP